MSLLLSVGLAASAVSVLCGVILVCFVSGTRPSALAWGGLSILAGILLFVWIRHLREKSRGAEENP